MSCYYFCLICQVKQCWNLEFPVKFQHTSSFCSLPAKFNATRHCRSCIRSFEGYKNNITYIISKIKVILTKISLCLQYSMGQDGAWWNECVTWVMGQGFSGSYGSWVTFTDPFAALPTSVSNKAKSHWSK